MQCVSKSNGQFNKSLLIQTCLKFTNKLNDTKCFDLQLLILSYCRLFQKYVMWLQIFIIVNCCRDIDTWREYNE